jgi:hypothetical protein
MYLKFHSSTPHLNTMLDRSKNENPKIGEKYIPKKKSQKSQNLEIQT